MTRKVMPKGVHEFLRVRVENDFIVKYALVDLTRPHDKYQEIPAGIPINLRIISKPLNLQLWTHLQCRYVFTK